MVMNDWNIFVIMFNTANIFFLLAFMAKKIVWLRILTITGMTVSIPYYIFIQEAPLWNNIFWVSTYASINLVMLLIIYLDSRPIVLSDIEKNIYNMTFKSLEPRVFKKLIDHGSFEEFQPDKFLVSRDSELDHLMYVVEGEAEVVLKHGEEITIPKGGFIGEQSYITGEKTSADVKVGKEVTKIIIWNSAALRKYLKGKESLKDNLDLIFTADLIHKLRDMEDDVDKIRHSQDLKIN